MSPQNAARNTNSNFRYDKKSQKVSNQAGSNQSNKQASCLSNTSHLPELAVSPLHMHSTTEHHPGLHDDLQQMNISDLLDTVRTNHILR